jgi:hypothetical protein
MFGTATDSAVVETPVLRAQAVAEVEEELAHIHAHDKRVYAHALEVRPKLFSRGRSGPLTLLCCKDFHGKVRIFCSS